ncbi:MAG: hypothetical protein HFG39_13375 [Lachnospiraceae bacterium]|nr:hypothetical protein [Lachnospiraceae bacterium]
MKKAIQEEKKKQDGKMELKFSKEQLLLSERFQERKDIIAALLHDGEQYTIKEAEERIEQYMKGKVK